MPAVLDTAAQARFTSLIQKHRKSKGLGQKEVTARIDTSKDLSGEISRFENAHDDVLQRWLVEPYLSKVAAAYKFNSPDELLALHERARTPQREGASDPWHPAFPDVERSKMEVPRKYLYYDNPLFGADAHGGPSDVIAKVPDAVSFLVVVVDPASGVETVTRQLQAAWAEAHPGSSVELRVRDWSSLDGLPRQAIWVEDWTPEILDQLLSRLAEEGCLHEQQVARARRMLQKVPERGLAGLPIGLVIEALAAEARGEGEERTLHQRLVSAEWERGVSRHATSNFTHADRCLYTDLCAALLAAGASLDGSPIAASQVEEVAARVLERRGHSLPDGAALAQRLRALADVRSAEKRQHELSALADLVVAPTGRRLVDNFVQMGLLHRGGDGVRPAVPHLAMLAAAWGMSEWPGLLALTPAVLVLPGARRLFSEMASFGASPEEVARFLAEVPGWAKTDRDHAWLRLVAASAHLPPGARTLLVDTWARVVYERSGPGRSCDAGWDPVARERSDLDSTLRVISERHRDALPTLYSLTDLEALVPPDERERIDAEAIVDPVYDTPPRSRATIAAVAPWQVPAFTFAEANELEAARKNPGGASVWPDLREVAATAALRGFPPARDWLRGDNDPESLFWNLPPLGRLACWSEAALPAGLATRAREEALAVLHQAARGEDLHRPVDLGGSPPLPMLHAALGLDGSGMTPWQLIVSVLRRSGGMPTREELPDRTTLPPGLWVDLADALDDVDELRKIEGTVEARIRGGEVTTCSGTVVAFGVHMESREPRFPVRQGERPTLPHEQLTDSLVATDTAGLRAAVALFRRGEEGPLRARASAEPFVLSDVLQQDWLDAWRLAELPDAPLDELVRALGPGDEPVLLHAVADPAEVAAVPGRAVRDYQQLARLGIDRPDLLALATAFCTLRHCGAGRQRRPGLLQLALPLDDRLRALCARISALEPRALDLQDFSERRAHAALRALVEVGDGQTLREWNATYRGRPRATAVPVRPYGDPGLAPPRAGGDQVARRKGILQRSVSEILANRADLRLQAWRLAEEPDAAEDVLDWALNAGEPFPTWVRRAIEKDAATGRAWARWMDLPAFRRERLTWIRAHEPPEAAGWVCVWIQRLLADGPDDVAAAAVEVVLDWVMAASEPFVAPRGAVAGRNPFMDLVFARLGNGTSDAPPPSRVTPRGPAWNDLVAFFDATLADPRCPKERVVAAIERLWDILLAAPLTHDCSLVEGEPVCLQIHEGSRDVFDDLARLLLRAGAPGRIERVLRDGVPSQEGDSPELIAASVSPEMLPRFAGMPPGARPCRTRAEILQLRLLARFRPETLDPRWLLVPGGLFEEWAWMRLAESGDEAAIERLGTRMARIDLGDPGWDEHLPWLSILLTWRPDDVARWLLGQARRSPEHAGVVRSLVERAADSWGARTGALLAWSRGGPMSDFD